MASICVSIATAYMGGYGNFGTRIGNLCSLRINASEVKLYKNADRWSWKWVSDTHSVRHKYAPTPS